MKRLCIFPKDIVKLTGVSERGAQRLLRKIRFELHKKKHQYITVKEYCEYMGVGEELILLE